MTWAFKTRCLFLEGLAHTLTELPRNCAGGFYGCLQQDFNAFEFDVAAVKAVDLKMSGFDLRTFPEWLQLILPS